MKSIETGVNLAPICAKSAYDLAVEEGEEIDGSGISEKYWQKASKSIL